MNIDVKLSFIHNESSIRRRNVKLFSYWSINKVKIVCYTEWIRQHYESK